MGKWSKTVKALPKLPAFDEEDPGFDDKVRKGVQKFLEKHPEGATPALVAHEYHEARRVKDRLKAQLKSANLDVAVMESLIRSTYENADISSQDIVCRYEDCECKGHGHKVGTSPEPVGQCENSIEKERYRLWCIEEGLEKEMHLHFGKTQSIIKERLEEGKPEPPGIKLWNRIKISLKKK